MSNALYDRDFFAWANEQAALLRSGRVSEADIGHIAEEIDSMGRTEKRELVNRLAVLLTHLLKWQYRRGSSWQATIRVQRRALARHLADNPSLKATFSETIAEGYGDAVIEAAEETGLLKQCFLRPVHGSSNSLWTRHSGRLRWIERRAVWWRCPASHQPL